MKILVIGNGFDLDHDLPTGYYQFIKFCDNIITFRENRKLPLKNLTPIQEKYFDELKQNNDLLNDFYSLLIKNNLYKYFSILCISKNNSNDKWIDLEAEILKVLNNIDRLEKLINSNEKGNKLLQDDSYLMIKKILGWNLLPLIKDVSVSQFRSDIFKQLNQISIALEMYICNFINQTPVELYAPNIIDFDADRVISFNYSNTYKQYYSPTREISYCNYIHGKANNSFITDDSNIVLGITDPLVEHDKRTENSMFEKYFQRISKNTSNEYRTWLYKDKNKDDEIEVAFFGHSLYVSDGDIINELIDEADKITIFYHDSKMYQEIIIHLTEIIGKKRLTELIFGSKSKIELKKQQEHLNQQYGGFEISKDIVRVNKLYSESEDSINSFLNKIKEKIKNKDVEYFYSQQSIIDLYYNLISHNINITNSEQLAEIASYLDFECQSFGAVEYNMNNYEFSGEVLDSKDFLFFIARINNDNNLRFLDKEPNPYMTIYGNCSDEHVTEIIKNELSDLNTVNQWKEFINFLVVLDNEIASNALTTISKSNLSNVERIKLLHLIEGYNYELQKFCCGDY